MVTSRSKRIWIQAPLGFGSGLPILLTGATMTAWLEDVGVSLKVIGFFALIHLPYNLKFLWAPLLDRFPLPWLGRRRGWILLTQLLLLAGIAVTGTVDAATQPTTIAMFALAVSCFSASQDIVVDAYRTDVLREDERGKGSATYVTGYRIAMIAAGGGALVLADVVSWRTTYWVMAALMVVGIVGTLCAAETEASKPPTSMREAVFEPLYDFFRRRNALLVIAIVLLYKVGEYVAGHMIPPFLLGLDFSKTEVGLVQKTFGLVATIGGCALGGVIADRIGVLKAMIIFGVLQAAANVGYLALALVGKDHTLLVVAIGVDNVCNGCGVAALMAFLMSLCNRRFSATQYALLASASSLTGRLLSATAGYVIAGIGWAGFFALSIVAALPALLLLSWYRTRDE
jgi:PAT family beta-lactamase induction signal transducer AmpG